MKECDDGMADKVLSLNGNFDGLKKLSDNCNEFIKNSFTMEVAKRVIGEDVK